jgi:hypothetical protein
MSTSPFTTIEEFKGATDGPTEGAIYTFAQNPTLNNIALVIAVGLFVWFIISTYATHHRVAPLDKSLSRLSSLIIVGFLSFVSADYRSPPRPAKPTQTQHTAVLRRAPSLSLLGLLGLGLPLVLRPKSRQRKKRYQRTTSSKL